VPFEAFKLSPGYCIMSNFLGVVFYIPLLATVCMKLLCT